MVRLLRAPLLVAFSLLLLIGVATPAVHAQTREEEAYAKCTGTPNPCASFDIEKNPILVFQEAKYAAGWKDKEPVAVEGREGLCKIYVLGPGTQTGCVSGNGNMTFVGAVIGPVGATDVGGSQSIDGDGNPTVEKGATCTTGNLVACILNIPGLLVSGIAYMILVLSSLILWAAGTVYNWVVIRTVFQFATYFGTSDGMLVAWGVMRDIANIGLLFGFIFMGVATILNTPNMEGYSAKRALPRLIIFAVLLNFSLFATQGIIDVANGFASVFSNFAGQEKCDARTSDQGGGSSQDCANIGISGRIISAAGISELPTAGQAQGALDRPYTTATMLIMLSILVTITAVVLLAAAIMLVIRVVVLSLLMVTSPIGFAGMAIPALNGIAKDWWHQLLNQSFFAPLYLLMVFISLKLLDGLNGEGSRASVTAAITGDISSGGTTAGNMQVLVVYAVVIGFMVASLMIAKKMGAAGAGFATNAASAVVYGSLARATNFAAGGATKGALQLARKYGGQNTVRAANVAHSFVRGSNIDMRRMAGMGALLGVAGATTGAKPAEHATFAEMSHQAGDIRDGKMMDKLKRQADADERTYRLNQVHGDTPLKDEQKRDLALITEEKELAALHGIKSGVASLARALSPEQFKKLMEGKELGDGEKEKLRNARLGIIPDQMARIEKGKSPTATVDEKEDAKKAKQELRSMSGYDLGQLGRSSEHGDLLKDEKLAALISDDQAEGLQKNDNLTVTQKQSAKNARKARFNAANAKTTIDAMSREQINKLDQDTVADDNVLPHIKPDHLVAMMDDNRYDATQKAKIENELKRKFDFTNAAATLSTMSPGKVAELSGAILTQPHVAALLDDGHLEKIQKAGNLSGPERAAIGTHIQSVLASPGSPRAAQFMGYLKADPRNASYWGVTLPTRRTTTP